MIDAEASDDLTPMVSNRQKKIAAAAGGGVILAVFLSVSLFYFWMEDFLKTPPGRDNSPVVFTIAPGQGLSAIARDLARDGLITDPVRFKLYARYKKAGTRLKAGEYELARTFLPDKVLDHLTSGKVKLYRFTIPEGLNMEEIAQVVEKAGICGQQTFLELCRDPALIDEADLKTRSLEGYLFPDTYLYPKSVTCRQIILRMTQGFHRVFTQKWQARSAELGYSVHEIVTLASIIEKETGAPEERPIIASVFHNRLKKGMRLESDPTVIYGQDDYHGRIRYKHLRRVTPYNTYQIQGLPVGPIASPGKAALRAALYPAKTDYLFFVSKNDSTHKFSRTLKEHNIAVQKYQLNR